MNRLVFTKAALLIRPHLKSELRHERSLEKGVLRAGTKNEHFCFSVMQ